MFYLRLVYPGTHGSEDEQVLEWIRFLEEGHDSQDREPNFWKIVFFLNMNK